MTATAIKTVFATLARTATVSSSDLHNFNHVGLLLYIDVDAITATPSVTFAIEVKDPIGDSYTALLTSAAVTGVGQTILQIHPGITDETNLRRAAVLPQIWRVTATHADADSITYKVTAHLTP